MHGVESYWKGTISLLILITLQLFIGKMHLQMGLDVSAGCLKDGLARAHCFT